MNEEEREAKKKELEAFLGVSLMGEADKIAKSIVDKFGGKKALAIALQIAKKMQEKKPNDNDPREG